MEILAVFGFFVELGEITELFGGDPALLVGDFLEASDFKALAVLDDADVFGGGGEGVGVSGVEPRGAAAEDLHVEFTGPEVGVVEVGDFEFAACGGFEGEGASDDLVVVEVYSGDSVF